MNCYCVVSHFKKALPAGIDLQEILPQHRAQLTKELEAGNVIIAGPHVWEDGAVGKGGVILIKAASKEAAEAVMQRDPLCINGIIEYTLHEFRVANVRPELSEWLGN